MPQSKVGKELLKKPLQKAPSKKLNSFYHEAADILAQALILQEEREIANHICHRCKKQADDGSHRVNFNFEFICNDCYRELKESSNAAK